MKTWITTLMGALLILLFAGMPANVQAQGKHKGDKHLARHEKGGPPAWAPAHGYRRKHDCEHTCKDKKKHHKDKKQKEDRWKKEDEAQARKQKGGSIFKRMPIPLPERKAPSPEKKSPFPTKKKEDGWAGGSGW